MNLNQFMVGFYILFWVLRINGCVRRRRQPLLRGREWFFDVHVQPGFYAGAGKKIVRDYWMRMFIPFALDIPLAIVIFRSGHLQLLNALILGLCAVIHINHCFSVDLAERQARRFAMPEAERLVASVALSLMPRRLRDYANWKIEWALAAANIIALVLLTLDYFAQPQHPDFLLVFGRPAGFLYLQLGFLFAKTIVLAWRNPVPQAHAAECTEAREQRRKFYLWQCDMIRAMAASGMLIWAAGMSVPEVSIERLMAVWLAALLVFGVGATVWAEIRRKQLVKLALRTRPMKLPDFLNEREIAKWPVCYQPSAPMLILRGAHGYSLNLANTLTYFGAAYLAGLTALFALLAKGR